MFWFGHGGWAPWGLGGLFLGFGLGLIKLLILVAVIVLIVRAVRGRERYREYRPRQATNSAVDILDARYARGEITADEYKEMKRTLQS